MTIEALYQCYKKDKKVSIDTRTMMPKSIFFAVRGNHFNGNDFALEALQRGASYVVVDEAKGEGDERYIRVPDSLQALQKLATYHRSQLTIPIVGLTGSNGKTTTKELCRLLLETNYRTASTQGNFNNHLGVPLTILSIDSSAEIAVVEMGANRLGEIAMLCKIANPTHGAITNIGRAHIGTFGGLENIIRAKSELYHHLAHKEKSVWVNAQDPRLVMLSGNLLNPMFYPRRGDYYPCELLSVYPFLRIKTAQGEVVSTHLTGAYNFQNIALALSIANFFGIDSHDARQVLEQYRPDNMRSQIIQHKTNTILLDTYNANPASMEVAIKNLAGMDVDRKVAILGDMSELGVYSHEEHIKILTLLQAYSIENVYLCGHYFCQVAKEMSSFHRFDSKRKLQEELTQHPIRQATILIKGSRSMALEEVVNYL